MSRREQDRWDSWGNGTPGRCAELTDAEKGYIAGLIDGEGCFKAYHYPEPKENGRIYQRCLTRLVIATTNEDVAHWLKRKVGGHIHRRGRQQFGWRNLWAWHAQAGVAIPLLEAVLPHMIIKRHEGELFLELMWLKWSHPRGRLVVDRERRQELIDAIREAKVA
jgi:hypothetical protein